MTSGDLDLSSFEELAESIDKRYPGSKQTRRMVEQQSAPTPDPDHWDARPIRKTVKGAEVEFFPVGALATALGRSSVTIRMWENTGILPKARYRSGGVEGKQRRLYTRAQIEGVVRIAQEEGILYITRKIAIADTQFTAKVVKLWKESSL